MTQENDYANYDLPGVGELRARRGTSTAELAGMAKHWHDKAKSAYIDGFAAGGVFMLLVSAVGASIYWLCK